MALLKNFEIVGHTVNDNAAEGGGMGYSNDNNRVRMPSKTYANKEFGYWLAFRSRFPVSYPLLAPTC